MKNIVLALALAIGLSVNAQVNKNVTKETTTKRTTVNNGREVKSSEVNQTRTAQQELDFKDAESNKLNKDLTPTPVAVTTSTTISGDGIPTQEIDRSSYYTLNGQRYQFVTDKTGYRVISGDNQNFGSMRRTSNNNYIYRSGASTSIGYFDKDGNFVVETYDDKTDGVTVQTYSRVRP
jgi:hypothetical protein